MANNIRKWDAVNGVDESEHRMVAFLDSVTDSYAILQLKEIDETAKEHFAPYSYYQRLNSKPSFDHYEVVYVGAIADFSDTPMGTASPLESAFYKFNTEIPSDFRGHSLSVSDVVALKINNEVSFNYVDSFGFKQLSWEPDNYLKNAEMMLEDDYGMIDGIINNGKKNEPQEQERESVLEKLERFRSAIDSNSAMDEREL